MPLMLWEDRFALNVCDMDNEHRELIRLMNELHECWQTGARYEQEAALEQLVRYTKAHFAHEEDTMQRMGFPDIERHKGHHRRLLDKFGQHTRDFKGGGELGEQFFSFLKFWLASHICGIDRKYGDYAGAADVA